MKQDETETLNDMERIAALLKHTRKSKNAFGISIGDKNGMRLTHIETGRNKISEKLANDIVDVYPEISYDWLLKGEGDMIVGNTREPEELSVTDPHELEISQNKNANGFSKLQNGQYLMTMPLADYSIQAGFLDVYQDIEVMAGLSQHSIIVDKPVKGRYVAFRVKGDSMDDGTSDAIPQNYIVSTRELQRQHWTSTIRYKDFRFWVIYTTQSKLPMLKEIIGHDVAKGIIKCHSLNDAPEYSDFELSLNEVQALFYVIDINRNVAKDYY